MKDTKTQCKGVKPDGSDCQAATMPGSEFCFFHDPTKATERRSAQSHGGSQNKVKTLPDAVPDVQVRDCEDVVKLLSETINQVRKGKIDPRVANAVGYLANVLIKAAEQGELEKRITEVEAVIKNRSNGSSLE